jgi:reactive intermediate/imine deaminase
MTPLEAIQAATINGAKVIGIEQSHGAIRAGKVANLVILNDNPSENIENVTDIAHVIKNGQFVHIGDDKSLPFVSAKKAGGMLWMSGQIGNFPSTKTLVGADVSSQMQQAMKNIGSVLQSYDLNYRDIAKCTLMLADIDDWQAANNAYLPFFETPPARSAYAAAGLALNAKVEVECIAEL